MKSQCAPRATGGPYIEEKWASLKTMGPLEPDGALSQQTIVPWSKRAPKNSKSKQGLLS